MKEIERVPNIWGSSERDPLLVSVEVVRYVPAVHLSVDSTNLIDFLKLDMGTEVGVGKYQVSTGVLSTNGVAGCLGIVMHDPLGRKGAVGHAFDKAGNVDESVPAAKTLIRHMVQAMGGRPQALELLIFNGFGLDWGEDRKTGLVAWIQSLGWSRIQDMTARTTGQQTISSAVRYEPATGTCTIIQ